jgi:hypothetical protein
VGSYINPGENVQEAVSKFQLAYDRAIKAESFASQGNVFQALDMWRKVFGDYFPAYG